MLNKIIVFAVCTVLCAGSLSADECIACDSAKDANCAQNPGLLLPQKCNSNESPKCYIRVINGITYRGCYNELDEGVQNTCVNDTTGQSCFVCESLNNGKGCNNIIFPQHRVRCHTCSENGLKGNCFSGFSDNATPCKMYNPDDKCYIRKTDKTIQRGCLSDTTKECNNPSHCFTCEGDGCNNLAGNNTVIPTAPSSAVAWTSTMATVLITVLVSLKVAN